MEMALSEALIVIGIGLIGFIGSLKLGDQLSTLNMSMHLGPARWTGALSLILLVCGIIAVIRHFLRSKSVDASTVTVPRIVSARGTILIALLAVWIEGVQILGFVVGYSVFLPLLFYIAGLRSWLKSVAAGIIMAVVFYMIFVWGANLSVPKGVIGIII